MKSLRFFCALAVLGAVSSAAQEFPAYPPLLGGLWEGADRIDVFGQDSVSVILKTFYGWYYDGSDSYRNDTTVPGKARIQASYTTMVQTENAWAGELSLLYPGNKIPFTVPVAVVDGDLYLDFAVVSQDGAYLQRRGIAHKVGRSPFYEDTELQSLYLADDKVYYIRYWLTDMDYEPEALADFSDGGSTYFVNKHIRTSGKVFTCTSGRETRIRNVTRRAAQEAGERIVFDAEKQIACFGSPYLSRIDAVPGQSESEQLEEIVARGNARRHSAPLR